MVTERVDGLVGGVRREAAVRSDVGVDLPQQGQDVRVVDGIGVIAPFPPG
ncbi:MAG: hypothetical protein ABI253_11705 [Mycobacterium sp.]